MPPTPFLLSLDHTNAPRVPLESLYLPCGTWQHTESLGTDFGATWGRSLTSASTVNFIV